jgi:hypothetical protein
MSDFKLRAVVAALPAVIALASLPKVGSAAPILAPGYSATVFATPPDGSSQPDSIAVDGSNVWIAYGNGILADGSQDNLSSQIVHYAGNGSILWTFNVPGHSDGLKIDPATHVVWAVQNEDGSPNLRVRIASYERTAANDTGAAARPTAHAIRLESRIIFCSDRVEGQRVPGAEPASRI